LQHWVGLNQKTQFSPARSLARLGQPNRLKFHHPIDFISVKQSRNAHNGIFSLSLKAVSMQL